MSKNNNINMERLDHYYDQRFSFKCSDIFKWCRRNISNPNFDVSYAASELYNHYFTSERRPNLQSYYYIRYNTNADTELITIIAIMNIAISLADSIYKNSFTFFIIVLQYIQPFVLLSILHQDLVLHVLLPGLH